MSEYDVERDYKAFLADLPALLEEHNGEVVVYHDGRRDVEIGTFPTLNAALDAGTGVHGYGNFIAQSVAPQMPLRMVAWF